jgi:hypothetical protein
MFTPPGREIVERKNHSICRQNAIEPLAIKLSEFGSFSLRVGLKKLRADEIPTENEEEIDSHPAEASYLNKWFRDSVEEMKGHDEQNGAGPQGIETMGT